MTPSPFFSRNVPVSGIEVKAEHLNGVFHLNLSIPRVTVILAEILLNISVKCCEQKLDGRPSCPLDWRLEKDIGDILAGGANR